MNEKLIKRLEAASRLLERIDDAGCEHNLIPIAIALAKAVEALRTQQDEHLIELLRVFEPAISSRVPRASEVIAKVRELEGERNQALKTAVRYAMDREMSERPPAPDVRGFAGIPERDQPSNLTYGEIAEKAGAGPCLRCVGMAVSGPLVDAPDLQAIIVCTPEVEGPPYYVTLVDEPRGELLSIAGFDLREEANAQCEMLIDGLRSALKGR